MGKDESNDYESFASTTVSRMERSDSTLHMWTQIVGKIRLTLTPPVNHSWNTTLYVTPRGLTTSTMPYKDQHFQIDFDFTDHLLLIQTAEGSTKKIALRPRSSLISIKKQ